MHRKNISYEGSPHFDMFFLFVKNLILCRKFGIYLYKQIFRVLYSIFYNITKNNITKKKYIAN